MFKEIPLNQIKPGRYQPRQNFDAEKLLDLATSIDQEGLLYPLVVFLDDDGHYELIGGERRWRAVCALHLANIGDFDGGLEAAISITAGAAWPEMISNGHYPHFSAYKIPANEQDPGITPEQQRVRAVADNLQRADLTPFEEAQALYDLKTSLKLSIRAVAAKVGKSKSWVGDRLGLLKLDAAAAQAIAAAETDEKTPSLDMTVIREVSRKLAEPLQAPVIEELTARAAKSTTDDLKKLVANLARLANPDNWAIESDFEEPTHPRLFNRSRLMIAILNDLSPEQLVTRLMKLHAKESYNNKLANKPANILNEWDFKKVARTLLGTNAEDVWTEIAPAHGWTCANCLKEPLAEVIETRVPEFEFSYETPCARLGIDAEASTCDQFVQAGTNADVPVITVPHGIRRSFDDDSHEAGMMKSLAGAGARYVESWPDYHHLYKTARQARAQQDEREKEEAKTAHLEPLRQYWHAQVDGDLDLYDFQSHACHKCQHFDKSRIEEHASPCKFAVEPLGRPDNPKAPDFGVLVDDQGRAVPRCSKFRYTADDMPAILGAPAKFQADDDAQDILLAWYQHITREASKQNQIYGVLAWLPGGKPTKTSLPNLWDQYTPAEVLLLLHIGISEAFASRYSFTRSSLQLLAPGGESTAWQALDWDSYTNQRTHYNWGDWPKPWAVRPADTETG